MEIHSIHLEGWRCFSAPVTFHLQAGWNLFAAPNGSGKSTIVEALTTFFFTAHTAKGRSIERLCPWTGSHSPYVALEFTHQGVRYRCHKRFLDQAESVVEQQIKGWELLHQGRAADEWLRALFHLQGIARGMTSPNQWGLAQLFWAPQEALKLDTINSEGQAALQAIVADEVVASSSIEEKVEARYLSFYTPSGRIRTGERAPSFIKLKAQLSSLQEQIKQQEEAKRRFSEQTAALKEVRERAQSLTKELKQAEESYDALFKQRKEQHKLLEEASLCEQARNLHKTQRQRLLQLSNHYESLLQQKKTLATEKPLAAQVVIESLSDTPLTIKQDQTTTSLPSKGKVLLPSHGAIELPSILKISLLADPSPALQQQKEQIEEALSTLQEQPDFSQRLQLLEELSKTIEEDNAHLTNINKRLTDAAIPSTSTIDASHSKVTHLKEQLEITQEQQALLQGALDNQQMGWDDEQLASWNAKADLLERQIAQEEGEARATRLLYETLAASRQEIITSFDELIRPKAETLWTLFSPPREPLSIEKGGALSPLNISVEELSGGEREQLHLVLRLACAQILHKGANQLPLLFDDTFVYSDAQRRAVTYQLLDEAAQKGQVLLFTCHTEWWEACGKGAQIDIQEK